MSKASSSQAPPQLPTAIPEHDLVNELFHRINRIIPPEQCVRTIGPDCKVRDAVSLMKQHGFSQLPVEHNGQILGVFSYRSFAQTIAKDSYEKLSRQKCAHGDLTVDEFMEHFDFARVTEELKGVFEALERDNGILVGTPERLISILTPMDMLRYLYQVASPFVMVSEIELALRALIRLVMTPDEISEAAKRCLAEAFRNSERIPQVLEAMTFENYISLIFYNDTWSRFFERIFGNRGRALTKLTEIREIRNDLFHFKREIKIMDHQTLADHRDWLLAKIKQTETWK